MSDPGQVLSVHVYKHGAEYVVRPATLVASTGATLRFFNLTGQRVVVVFPHQEFKYAAVPIEAGKDGSQLLPEVRQRDVFPYAVYSAEARDFCRGGSSPEVIIEK